jgi:heme ABC exporter ATP-binding subunit CcmA
MAAIASHIPAMEARRLSVERNHRLVLDGVDLSVARGEIVAVMGANGAGKTTLLRCLAGLSRPAAGEVFWFGQSPRQDFNSKRFVGMAAHQRALYRELSARENLTFAAELCGLSKAAAHVEQMLSLAGLQQHADLPTRRLSHGLQQRLSLCRALVHDPLIVLLDEPSAGLDEDGQHWARQLLLRLKDRERAVCLTTHDRSLAQCLPDRIVYLQAGRLSAQKPTWPEAA